MYIRSVILGCAAFALSAPAMAQDANIDGRVGKLEKEMRAVQRQVFPNGAGKFVEPEIQSPAAPSITNSSTSVTVDLTARIDALEAQLATLTGQVELQGNNMRGLEGRLKIIETQLAAQALVKQDGQQEGRGNADPHGRGGDRPELDRADAHEQK